MRTGPISRGAYRRGDVRATVADAAVAAAAAAAAGSTWVLGDGKYC